MKIIKLIPVLALLSICVPRNLHAQTVETGVKGGLNFSTLFIDEVTDENMRTGFNAGVFARFLGPAGKLGFQPELLYSAKGSKGHYDFLGFNGERKFNLNYIDLPLLLVIKPGNNFAINAGAYVSYLLNASISTDGDLGSSYDELDRDNFKTIDYGLVGGIAFEFTRVSVGARYNYGLQQVADDEDARDFLGNAKNGVGQLYIAFYMR